jgi:enoyl-CoA hydratase
MAEYGTILVEQRGAVTLVTLNRPEALNALSSAVLEDLIAAFAAFEADETQRCAVVTGAGDKAFAAGDMNSRRVCYSAACAASLS